METRDILNVELLSTGTFHGIGSPPEGDAYTEADLDSFAEAASALPLKRPLKLGHNKYQQFAQTDGLPAVGWVENLRRVGTKLVGDFRNVAAKVADLIDAGAYRTRSAEVFWNYEDSEGNVWPRVFKAVALLGADTPAVTNLDDIVALYEEEKGEVHVYTTEDLAGDARGYAIILPLSEKGSFEWISRQIKEVLPQQSGTYWWVEKTYPQFAVIERCVDTALGNSDRTTWIVPYTIDADGLVTLGPQSEWQEVEEQELFVKAAGYAEATPDDLLTKLQSLMDEMESAIKGRQGAPRLRMWVAEAHKGLAGIISQQKAAKDAGTEGKPGAAVKNQLEVDIVKEHVYELLGLAEDVSEEDAFAKLKELSERPAPDMKSYVAIESPEYKELRSMAEEGRAAKQRLYEMERGTVLDAAIEKGQITAAEMDKWAKRYDRDPEGAREILSELPVKVDYSERGSATGGAEGKSDNGETMVARATELQAQHPDWDYKTCVIKASQEV